MQPRCIVIGSDQISHPRWEVVWTDSDEGVNATAFRYPHTIIYAIDSLFCCQSITMSNFNYYFFIYANPPGISSLFEND